MKLFYFISAEGNVGDDLNPWLWPKIFQQFLNEDDQHLLLGIGTILNSKLPEAKKYTIISSGVGYHNQPNFHGIDCDFVALRGPLSEQILGVEDKQPVLLDGAYLMPLYLPRKVESKAGTTGFIPHVDSLIVGPWEEICAVVGLKLLDPRWSVEKFITELCECENVITEAMHGAILADAYRIPWFPVKGYEHINDFKWQDWSKSLLMEVSLHPLVPIWRGDQGLPVKRKIINGVKRFTNSLGIYPKKWHQVLPTRSSVRTFKENISLLTGYKNNSDFILSRTDIMKQKTDQLHQRILDYKNSLS